MEYIVIDLEFNQAFEFEKGTKTVVVPKIPFEIIQIGAIKLDQELNIIGSFDCLIKPQLYTRIHPFVEKITGIKHKMLSDKKSFVEAYAEFSEFVGSNPYKFCIWGDSDIRTLFSNIQYYKLDESKMSKTYINIQSLTSIYLKNTTKQSIGLKTAVECLNIETDISFHSALHDAIYTAKIFQIIKTDNLPEQLFQKSELLIKKNKNSTTNYELLFAVVEKSYGRRLTNKEKDIAKKIYNMGKTKQFDTKPIPQPKK